LHGGGKTNEVFDLTRDMVFAVFWIGCVLALLLSRKAIPHGYTVYAATSLALALISPMHAHPYDRLSSMPRYILVIFPCFLPLACWMAPSRARSLLITAVSLLVLTCFVGVMALNGFIS